MIEIKFLPLVGSFGEDKDLAKKIRIDRIQPALESGENVVLDFMGVTSITQSFGHALISELIRIYGIDDFVEKVNFSNCTDTTRKIIEIVVDYMQ